MTEAEILAEATRIATTVLYTSAAEAEIADALRRAYARGCWDGGDVERAGWRQFVARLLKRVYPQP